MVHWLKLQQKWRFAPGDSFTLVEVGKHITEDKGEEIMKICQYITQSTSFRFPNSQELQTKVRYFLSVWSFILPSKETTGWMIYKFIPQWSTILLVLSLKKHLWLVLSISKEISQHPSMLPQN